MVLHLGERKQLVHTGEHQELLGFDPLQTTPVEQICQIVSHRPPIPLQAVLSVDLLTPQIVGNLARRVAEGHVEGIAEAMRRIGGDDEGAVT